MYFEADIKEFMIGDHKLCDESLANVEVAVSKAQENRYELFEKFYNELIHHFSMEELVLFPALNSFATKERLPLRVMEMEHEKIRLVLGSMRESLDDRDRFLSFSETLMMLLQQHNIKEESQIYAPANTLLEDEAGYILSQMRTIY